MTKDEKDRRYVRWAKAVRKSGLSLAEISRRLKPNKNGKPLNSQTVYNWNSGSHVPSVERIRELEGLKSP